MISYHVPYDDVFEDVAVVVRARRHFFCLSLALQRNTIQGVSFNWYPPNSTLPPGHVGLKFELPIM